MMTTTFERGLEKGMEKGERQTIRRQLEKKFGPLSPAVQQRLEDWPAERLEELALDLLDATSLRALGLED